MLIVKYSLPLLFPSSLCLSLSLRYPPHLPSLPPSLYLSLPPLSLSLRYSEDGAYWRMSIEHASWSPRAGMSALVFSQTQRTSLWVSVCLSLSVSESVFVCLSLSVCMHTQVLVQTLLFVAIFILWGLIVCDYEHSVYILNVTHILNVQYTCKLNVCVCVCVCVHSVGLDSL